MIIEEIHGLLAGRSLENIADIDGATNLFHFRGVGIRR
jgi:hypothetical protein